MPKIMAKFERDHIYGSPNAGGVLHQPTPIPYRCRLGWCSRSR